MYKNFIKSLICLFVLLPAGITHRIQGMELKDLPFEGYYINQEDNAIEGLVFKENELYVYVKVLEAIDEDLAGYEDLAQLTEFHSFPYPDLNAYSQSVKQVYMEEFNLPFDLQEIYQNLLNQIEPKMSQEDVLHLLNQEIPGIYYTQRAGYHYFIIASPSVTEVDDGWQVFLFGQELFTFKQAGQKILDHAGREFEYVDGILPH